MTSSQRPVLPTAERRGPGRPPRNPLSAPLIVENPQETLPIAQEQPALNLQEQPALPPLLPPIPPPAINIALPLIQCPLFSDTALAKLTLEEQMAACDVYNLYSDIYIQIQTLVPLNAALESHTALLHLEIRRAFGLRPLFRVLMKSLDYFPRPARDISPELKNAVLTAIEGLVQSFPNDLDTTFVSKPAARPIADSDTTKVLTKFDSLKIPFQFNRNHFTYSNVFTFLDSAFIPYRTLMTAYFSETEPPTHVVDQAYRHIISNHIGDEVKAWTSDLKSSTLDFSKRDEVANFLVVKLFGVSQRSHLGRLEHFLTCCGNQKKAYLKRFH